MPARDTYHNPFRQALIKDGWTITDDPLRLVYGTKDLYVDIGAERFVAAEKGQQRIAVEIKSFLGESDVVELRDAFGQFGLYRDILAEIDPERILYLAIRQVTYNDVFEEPIGQLLLRNQRFRLVVFDEEKEVLLRWIPEMPTGT